VNYGSNSELGVVVANKFRIIDCELKITDDLQFSIIE
jgi:hypothetical protein